MGIVDGITTNPSLIAKEDGEFEAIVLEICKEVNGPVSVEVVSTNYDGMVNEAKAFSKFAPNVVVKLPITPEGLRATKTVSAMGIPVNMTRGCSANQGLLAAKAGASYVSPFIGRLDDIGHRGMDVIEDLVKIFGNYSIKAEVLVGSVRHPLHVIDAAKAGAQIATLPPEVLEKMIHHPLTDSGLEKFLKDWKASQKEKPSLTA
jgi:transaldolase